MDKYLLQISQLFEEDLHGTQVTLRESDRQFIPNVTLALSTHVVYRFPCENPFMVWP